MEQQEHSRDLLWKNYVLLVDLYKFYFSAAQNFFAFYLLISGGIASYILSHNSLHLNSALRLVLILPIAIGVVATAIYFYAIAPMMNLQGNIKKTSSDLGLSMYVKTEFFVFMLGGYGFLIAVIAIGLLVLFCLTCSKVA